LGSAAGDFSVCEYSTLTLGGLIFVRLSDTHDLGFRQMMEQMATQFHFLPGFEMKVQASVETVIENGFDNAHFKTVHAILNEPDFETEYGASGELRVTGELEIPGSPWKRGPSVAGSNLVPYAACCYSPGIMIAEIGGAMPYRIITAATPDRERGSKIHLSLAVPQAPDISSPDKHDFQFLLEQSKSGLEKDNQIWEHLARDISPQFTARDASVIEFQKFCQEF
jgi:hypothetical protein